MIKLDYVNGSLVTTNQKSKINRLNINAKAIFKKAENLFKEILYIDNNELGYTITDNPDLNRINRRLYEMNRETSVIRSSIKSRAAYVLVWTAIGVMLYQNAEISNKMVSGLCLVSALSNGVSCYCKKNILDDYRKEKRALIRKRKNYFDI